MVEVKPSPEIVASEEIMICYNLRNPLLWVREIIQEEERYGAPEGSTRSRKRSKPYFNYVALMYDLVY